MRSIGDRFVRLIDFAFPWIPAFAGMTRRSRRYVWSLGVLIATNLQLGEVG